MFDLRSIYIFESIQMEQMDEILQNCELKKFKKNNIVFFEGEIAEHLNILLTGKVRLFKTDHKANEVLIDKISAPSIIAEMPAFEQIAYPATCTAENDVEILKIKISDLTTKILQSSQISFQIIKSMSKKIKQLEYIISRSISMNATQKIAKFLIENEKDLENISQKEMSKILCIQPETSSRILAKMKENQIVKINKRKIEILDNNKINELLQKYVNKSLFFITFLLV